MIGIALYRGVSGLSRLIRFQTRSCYSHAAFIDTATHEVFESTIRGKGVQGWIPAGKLHTAGTVVDVFVPVTPLSMDEEHRLRLWLAIQQGKGYDFLGILRFIDRRRHVDNDRRWFCSELVFSGFLDLGRALLVHIPAYAVAPAHLAWSPLLRRIGQFTTGEKTPLTPAEAFQAAHPWAEAAGPNGGSNPEAFNAKIRASGKSRGNASAEAVRPFCTRVAPFCTGIGPKAVVEDAFGHRVIPREA